MDSLYNITSSFFFLWIVRNIFYWIWEWQDNDYSLSSFAANFISLVKNRNIFENCLYLYKLVLIFLFYLFSVNDRFFNFYYWLINFVYVIEFAYVLKEIYRNELKKPSLTLVGIIIFLLVFSNSIFLYSIPLIDKFVWLIVIDLLLMPSIGFLMFLISFPTEIYTDIRMEKAIRKMKANKNIKIIMLIGTYGINETKNNITQVLKNKYKVHDIPQAESTVLGICKNILKKMASDTDIIVTPIKVHTLDEVRRIYKMIPPQIVVVTGIDGNKLYAEGNTGSSKAIYDLIMNILPKTGFVMFNGRDKNSYWLYKASRKNKVLYNYLTIEASIAINSSSHHFITAFNVSQKNNAIIFNVVINNQSLHLNMNKTKEYKIEQILPAIYIASYLGYKKMDLKKAVFQLE